MEKEYIEREATCRDCIHYPVCKDTWADENWNEDAPKEVKEMFSPKGCENFKPTADVVEERHGVWVKTSYPEVHRCSCCNKPSNTSHGLHNYCPECGAKMDGKGDKQ